MTQPEPALGDLLALRLGGVQVALLVRVLAGTLADALPAEMVTVRRHRTPADRLRGRPGQPIEVVVTAEPDELLLRSRTDGGVETRVVRTVRGVRLSDSPVPVADWLVRLGSVVQRRADTDAAAREALQRFLLG